MRRLLHTLFVPLVAVGCAASSSGGASGGKSDAGARGGGAGSMGEGGSGGSAAGSGGSGGNVSHPDAAPGTDARYQPPSNLTDAPPFKWDACAGCDAAGPAADAGLAGGSGGSASGGAAGSGGKGGSGGSTTAGSGGRSSGSGGQTSSGGSVGTGGSGAGGMTTSGSGGMSVGGVPGGGAGGLGGATGRGGMTGAQDAGVFFDAGADGFPVPSDGGRDGGGGGARDTGTVGPDSGSRCVAQIRLIVPSTPDFANFPLVAGSTTQVVLRAEVVSGPTKPVWTWRGYRDGKPIAYTAGTVDTAEAMFPVAEAGTYLFTAFDDTTCAASVSRYALPTEARAYFNDWVVFRAAPPPGGDSPVQGGAYQLNGADLQLKSGQAVGVSPSVAGALIRAYVRISGDDGSLVADGLADPTAQFGALLLPVFGTKLLYYDVLVVPMDGSSGGTTAATAAPQLFPGLLPAEINQRNSQHFPLSGGVSVTGSTLSSGGTPVTDARVILTNHNPSDPQAATQLVFSSVGRTGADGSFDLRVQPGQYWVSISPPVGSGLGEALASTPITITGNTSFVFTWTTTPLTTLSLLVSDTSGAPLDGARVRVTSAQPATVGSLTLSDGSTQSAQGNVRAEGMTAGGGRISFANLPADVAYSVLVVPGTLGPLTATTIATVNAPSGGGSQVVQVARQSRINGKLIAPIAGVTADWSQVSVVAYDRTLDTPEAAQAVSVDANGNFTIGVSPRRSYVVLVVPSVASGMARTFVGPGPLEASEFVIQQKVPAAQLVYTAHVIDANSVGLPGTALQAFCDANWPGCVDGTIPLAETTTGADGIFQLYVPDATTEL